MENVEANFDIANLPSGDSDILRVSKGFRHGYLRYSLFKARGYFINHHLALFDILTDIQLDFH